MFINYNNNPIDTKHYDTTRLREEFLTEELFKEESIVMVYSHIDRVVAMGASPSINTLKLNDFVDEKAFGTDFFLQRRELGIINLGEKAEVRCKNQTYVLNHLDALYLGK